MKIELDENDTRQKSHYVFELTPSDGTKYTVEITPALYGGLNVICNESSLWRWYSSISTLRFLCGNDNEYTCRAIIKIMMHHDRRMIEIEG